MLAVETYKTDYKDYVVKNKAALNQHGGIIYKNESKGAGGGIYVSSSYVNIEEGMLLNNTSSRHGGAIYASIEPYRLTLKDMLVTENHAFNYEDHNYESGNGGGVWNCPVGAVTMQDGHSLYVFDNTAENEGLDYYFVTRRRDYTHNGEIVGDNFLVDLSPVTKDRNLIDFKRTDGEVVDYMKNTYKTVTADATYDDETILEAWRNAKVFILDNKAPRGGGVGSNANLDIPGTPGDYNVHVEKIWDEEIYKPKSLRVDLYIGEIKYAEKFLTEENNWKEVFSDLPFSKEELDEKGVSYRIEEVPAIHYKTTEAMVMDEHNLTFTLTNKPYFNLPVKKIWDDSIEIKDRPEKIEVVLQLNGKDVLDDRGNPRRLTLESSKNYEGIFQDIEPLKDGDRYSLRELSKDYPNSIEVKSQNYLSFIINRVESESFPLSKDYTGIKVHIKEIPVELSHDGNLYKTLILPRSEDKEPHLSGQFLNIPVEAKDVKIEYYDHEGEPFPRNIGTWEDDLDFNDPYKKVEGVYNLYTELEGETLTLYVPKLSGEDEELFQISDVKLEEGIALELKNYKPIEHEIIIEKEWRLTDHRIRIPQSLQVNLNIPGNKDFNETVITLNRENNWRYEIKGLKGSLSGKDIEVSEEYVPGFYRSKRVMTSLVSDEPLKVYLNEKRLQPSELSELLLHKNYRYEVDLTLPEHVIQIRHEDEVILSYNPETPLKERYSVLFINREIPRTPEDPETDEPEVPETDEPEVPETDEPDVPETDEPEKPTPELPRTGVGFGISLFLGLITLGAGTLLVKEERK